MEQSQWDASFGGYLEGHQTGFLGSSAQGSDGQPYHAGHAVAEQEYGNDLISPSSHAQQAAGTQVDAQDIQQYLRPRDEAPRAFLGHAGTARPPLQPNSWLHHSFPLSNNASVDLAAQGFHRQLAMQQPSPGSVSESGYGSFNARPTDFQQQPHTPLSGYGGFPTQHQPDTALYTREDPPQSVYSDLTPDRAPAKPLRTNPRTRTKVHVPPCVSCGKVLRNLSDAHKHQHQHEKPWKCQERGCTRTEGFATPNDLERHRKSVHGKVPVVGGKDGYICAACPASTPGAAAKFWPRRDNFRAHIRRKHQQYDEARLVELSVSARPASAISESGYGTEQHSQADPQDDRGTYEMTSPILSSSMERHSSQQGDYSFFQDGGNLDEFAGIGGQLADAPAGRSDRNVSFHDPSGAGGDGLSVLSAAAATCPMASSYDSLVQPPQTAYGSIPRVFMGRFDTQDLPPQGPGQAQWSQQCSSPSKAAESSSARESRPSKHPDGDLICPEPDCGKRKKRDCDLKKHMKRHTRPYGCTFPNCWKQFGSRNDWKRHEGSQHFLQEMWRCDHLVSAGRRCGKLAYSKSVFQTHLKRKHADLLRQQRLTGGPPASIVQQSIEREADHMHLGREGNIRFWCGFCNQLISQDEGTHNAWELRFNHIGDHFDKDQKHIDSWICIEENKQKCSITKDERRKAKQRSRMGRLDEDSDLGESGIVEPLPFGSGIAAPGAFAPPSHVPAMLARRSMNTSNKRQRIEEDADADGVSDDEGWQ